MEIVFLGTGTSQGAPMIAHKADAAYDLDDPKNWRDRTCAHVVMGGQRIQIDAGPEFRRQCLRERLEWIDLFLLTHPHADHILGMDDLRRFCDQRGGGSLPVYSSEEGLRRVREIFPYAMPEMPRVSGYPRFELELAPSVLETEHGTIHSTFLPHGPTETLGFVFDEKASGRRLAYFTDCKSLTPEATELAQGCDLLALDALRPKPHPSHMCIDEAIEAAREIGASQTWFVHMTSHVDYATWQQRLPEGMAFAWDGLRVAL